VSTPFVSSTTNESAVVEKERMSSAMR